MQAPRPFFLCRLTSLYFPFSLLMTAVLVTLLPMRVEALAGQADKGLYIACIGGFGAVLATGVCLVVGAVSDNTRHPRGRRYPWILGGMSLGALACFGLGLANSLWLLLLSYGLMRLGLHTGAAAFDAVVPDRVPLEYQCRASGWGEIWELLGQTVGLGATAFLFTAGCLNQLLHRQLSPLLENRMVGILVAAGCAVLLLGFLVLNAGVLKDVPAAPEPAVPLLASLGRVLKLNLHQVPDFTRLWISRCALNMGIYTGVEFLYYYVETMPHHGANIAGEVSWIGLASTAGGVFGAISGGYLGDRFSKRRLLYVYCGISTVAAVCFCLTQSLVMARFIGFFYGIGYSAISTVDWAFATNLLPRGQEGRYLAVFQTAFNGPQVLVTLLGGWLGWQLGFRVVFWTIPLYFVVGMIVLSMVRERHEIPGYSEISPT